MKSVLFILLTVLFQFYFPEFSLSQTESHPNVILIITDDQGYGDLGITGNPHVKTPVIDKFARKSIHFNDFYVSPVVCGFRFI